MASKEKRQLNITLSESVYKKLVFLQQNNYFEELTESEVIENLIITAYSEYQEAFEREVNN